MKDYNEQVQHALDIRGELLHEIKHGPVSRRAVYRKMLFAGGALAALSQLRGGNKAWAGDDPARTSFAPPTTPFLEPLVHVNRPEHVKAPGALPTAPTREANVSAGEARRAPHQAWAKGFAKTYLTVQRQVDNYSVHRELPGQSVWTYDGKLPGPTYHGRWGEPMIVRIRNELPQNHTGFGNPETSTHLHNMHNPSESDGNPDEYYPRLNPLHARDRDTGAWRDFHYPGQLAGGDPNEALGTLWYHDHRHDFTAPNTTRGLAGFHLMFDEVDSGDENDRNPKALRLPSGEYDVPLMLADRFFDHYGRLQFDQFNLDGILGNKYLVNGKIQPVMQVEPRKYRLRVLNAGPSRVYGLMLLATADTRSGLPSAKPLPTAFLIGTGGNLLPRPIPMPQPQALGAADRLDIWVDFSNMAGQQVFLANAWEQDDGRGPKGYRGSGPNGAQYDRVAPVAMMRFDVVLPKRGDAPPLPQTLRPLPWDPNDAIGRLSERQILGAADKGGSVAGGIRVREWRFDRSNGMWTINGKLYDGASPAAVVGKNTQEIWVLRNGGKWVHPAHVHMEEFRTLFRDGKKPGPDHVTYGRDDVMTLGPGETGIMAMKFRDYTGKYVMHCHNSVHEDHAMMIRFDIQG